MSPAKMFVAGAAMGRTVRGRATAAMILSVGASAAGAGYAGDLIYLGTLASVFGYSREKETEADMMGFDQAVAAEYDSGAGAAIWRARCASSSRCSTSRARTRRAGAWRF